MGLIGLNFFWRPWGLILQAIAVFHFVRRRPDGYWLWIILIGGGLGAMAYIVAEVIPDAALLGGSLAGFSRRRRIGELEGLIQVNPAIGNREELADLYLEEHKYAEARRLYDQVIKAQPDDIDPYYRRGLAALAMADAQAALGDLERVAFREDPSYHLPSRDGTARTGPESGRRACEGRPVVSSRGRDVDPVRDVLQLRFVSGEPTPYGRRSRVRAADSGQEADDAPVICAGGSGRGLERPRRCSIGCRLTELTLEERLDA